MASRYPDHHQPSDRDMYHFGQQLKQPDSGRTGRPDNFAFHMPTNGSPFPPRLHRQSRIFSSPPRPFSTRDSSPSHNRQISNQRGRRGGKQRQRPPRMTVARTADRALLMAERAPTPEQMKGMNEGESRFRNVDDMSDSEEEDMQLETDTEELRDASDNGEIVEPSLKRVRRRDDTNVPRWSNPDPYTALPPTDQNPGKRKDVVKLIRKAKASAASTMNTKADRDDFISFDLAVEGENSYTNTSAVEDADGMHASSVHARPSQLSQLRRVHPESPQSPHRMLVDGAYDNKHKLGSAPLFLSNLPYFVTGRELEDFFRGFSIERISFPEGPSESRPCNGTAIVQLSSPAEIERAIATLNGRHLSERKISMEIAKPNTASASNDLRSMKPTQQPLAASYGSVTVDIWPPAAAPPLPRTHLNELKMPTISRTTRKRGLSEFEEDDDDLLQRYGPSKAGRKKYALGINAIPEWRPKLHCDAHPWIRDDYSKIEHVGLRLHREICDLYDFLKPRHFENTLRETLVKDVQQCLDVNMPGCEVRFFGSFAAGLYLPEGDMDLVVFSREFRKSGRQTLQMSANMLRRFGNMLAQYGIVKSGSLTVIAKARVPIIKYIDRKTLLKVDISFENDTGVTANRTYIDWKAEFPALPVLVTLVKQFLLMRSMNEVHTGGLGGFSVTCIVVSLMQNMPHIASGDMDPMSNLGELFMTFLDFYGNKFNLENTGIELDPPRYFPKKFDDRIKYNPGQAPKLAIIDPNCATNDVSSGSRNVQNIFKAFSVSFGVLQARMADVRGRRSKDGHGSILGSLYAGDYTTFIRQRAHMEDISNRGA